MHPGDSLDDRGAYPWAVAGSADARGIFSNCYVVCHRYSRQLQEMAGSRGSARREFLRERKHAEIRLSQLGTRASGIEFEDSDLQEIRDLLGGESGDAALRRTGALLTALSAFLRARIGRMERLGPVRFRAASGDEFHVSTTPCEPLWGRGKVRPEHEVSDMLVAFHPGLTVTPAVIAGPDGGNWRIERKVVGAIWRNALKGRAGSLKIAVCPMTAHPPNLRKTREPEPGDPTPWVIASVDGEDEQVEFLERILNRCVEERISVLVLPELRATPRLRGMLEGWLRAQRGPEGLLLVVAGSWHVEDGGHYVNRCHALDGRGRVLWTNDKLAEYHITVDNVRKAKAYWEACGIGENGGVEDIALGGALVVADTPLGRMTTAICAGFFQKSARHVMENCDANFFFVPTMSPKMDRLETVANVLAWSNGATFVANCGSVGTRAPSFWCDPLDGLREAHIGQELLIWQFDNTLGTLKRPSLESK